jgi:ankyrin repeat protein
MSYAANLGRNRIVRMLHDLGARDLQWALDRAILQGQLDTARMLYEMGARPADAAAAMEGPAETLNAEGMALLLDLGVTLTRETAPVAMVLQTYGRNPDGKHRILELFARHGIPLPDTPPMAVHRGRIDLLEAQLRRDPELFSRTFSHEEIFPPELGCHADHSLALHGTPLGGAGLLHVCAEYDEIEIARWAIERGADVNLRARVDADGFGGHTPLFNAVVSLYGGRRRRSEFAALLLDHGADPTIRASLRKGLRFADDESVHEYRDVTAAEWGERFHERSAVNEPALALVAERTRVRE